MENMTKAQLQSVCDQKGIAYNSKTTKQELIDRINSSKKEAEVGNPFDGEY